MDLVIFFFFFSGQIHVPGIKLLNLELLNTGPGTEYGN